METILAFVIGALFAAGLYMLMRRSFVKLIIGLSLLGQAANMLIFMMGGIIRGRPPLIGPLQETLSKTAADPVPQALILTAIVIGFGMQAFFIVLVKRAYQTLGTDDVDKIRATDL